MMGHRFCWHRYAEWETTHISGGTFSSTGPAMFYHQRQLCEKCGKVRLRRAVSR